MVDSATEGACASPGEPAADTTIVSGSAGATATLPGMGGPRPGLAPPPGAPPPQPRGDPPACRFIHAARRQRVYRQRVRVVLRAGLAVLPGAAAVEAPHPSPQFRARETPP